MKMTVRKWALLELLDVRGELSASQLLKGFDPMVRVESLRSTLNIMERDGWVSTRFAMRDAQRTKLYSLTALGSRVARPGPGVPHSDHPHTWDD